MNKPKLEELTQCEVFLSQLDFNSLTSTAELELHAAVAGISIDEEFTYGWIVSTFIFKTAFSILLDGIADGTFSIFTDKDIGPKIVLACLLNAVSVGRPFVKLPSGCDSIRFSDNLYTCLIRREFNDTCDASYGNRLLNVVFRKNPLVVFKLYHQFGSVLHSSQKYVTILIIMLKLIKLIPDNSKYSKLRDAFLLDYSRRNRQTMFMC